MDREIGPHRKVRLVEPYPFTHSLKIKKSDVGKTILAVFVDRFPFRSREDWIIKFNSEQIKYQNNPIDKNTNVKAGQIYQHINPSIYEPSVPDEMQVLVEENDWLAVYKPSPMPMHAGGRYNKNSLEHLVRSSGFPEAQIVHRLDAVTSGIVLFARNEGMAKHITQSFADGSVQKEYVALVEGKPNRENWTVSVPVRRKSGYKFEWFKPEDGQTFKPAETSFTLINQFDEKSLVKCHPKTGRTHQIRLHLAYSGHPIVDDWTYNLKKDVNKQDSGIALCHTSIQIPNLDIDVQFDFRVCNTFKLENNFLPHSERYQFL